MHAMQIVEVEKKDLNDSQAKAPTKLQDNGRMYLPDTARSWSY
jgi:hypothetical protein